MMFWHFLEKEMKVFHGLWNFPYPGGWMSIFCLLNYNYFYVVNLIN